MTQTRRQTLEASLARKEAKFNEALSSHMYDVKGAQGEPMAGHHGGEKVLSRWERQNNSLRRQSEGIEKTKKALEREDYRDLVKVDAQEKLLKMPQIIQDLVSDGTLNQWKKHPTIFFVDGVSKARIQIKGGKAYHRFASQCANNEEFQLFRSIYNKVNKEVNL